MSKKVRYKKKYKGTRYVAKVLNKYFKLKYPTYNSALPKAREINSLLKLNGTKFTVKNVSSFIRKPQKNKFIKQKPLLFYKLSQIIPYYEMIDYPTYIFDTTNEIYFTSDLFNEEVEIIQGGQRPSYKKTFQAFVQFMNKEQTFNNKRDSEDITCYIKALDPELDPVSKKWISKIISVTKSGEDYDFGYEKSINYIEGSAPGEPGLKRIAPNKSKLSKTTKPQQSLKKDQKSAENEARKLDLIENAMKLYNENKINKQTFEIIIKNINKK
jgi:hypothetical protein